MFHFHFTRPTRIYLNLSFISNLQIDEIENESNSKKLSFFPYRNLWICLKLRMSKTIPSKVINQRLLKINNHPSKLRSGVDGCLQRRQETFTLTSWRESNASIKNKRQTITPILDEVTSNWWQDKPSDALFVADSQRKNDISRTGAGRFFVFSFCNRNLFF
jgi:hypothetical protein